MTRIRKRDGRVVDYDEGKVAHEILQAAQSAGDANPAFAAEMAEVVSFFLRKHHGSDVQTGSALVVEADHVDEMIEKVLLQTNPGTAKSFMLRRKRRQDTGERASNAHAPEDRATGEATSDTAARTRRDRQHRARDAGYGQHEMFPDALLMVEAESTAEAHRWSRARVVDELVDRADLDRPTAEGIADQVAERLFATGLPRVRSGLVRDMVGEVLFEQGLYEARDRVRVIGLPKTDLDEALARGRVGDEGEHFRDAQDVHTYVQEQILRRYALTEIHAPEVAGAHVEGRIHLHGLGQPLLLHSLRVCPIGILHGWPRAPRRDDPPSAALAHHGVDPDAPSEGALHDRSLWSEVESVNQDGTDEGGTDGTDEEGYLDFPDLAGPALDLGQHAEGGPGELWPSATTPASGLPRPTPPAPPDTAASLGGPPVEGRARPSDRLAPPATEEQFLALLRRYAEECAAAVQETVTFSNLSLVLAPLVERYEAEGRRRFLRRVLGALSGRLASSLVLEFPLGVPASLVDERAIGLGGEPVDSRTLGDYRRTVLALAQDIVWLTLEGAHQATLAPDVVLVIDESALVDPDAQRVLEVAADCVTRHGAPRLRFPRSEPGSGPPARAPYRPGRGPAAAATTPVRTPGAATKDLFGATTDPAAGRAIRLAPAGPSRLVDDREVAVMAVSLNLPQAAYRAGRGQHDVFADTCDQLLRLTRKAITERVHFLLGALAQLRNPVLAVGHARPEDLHPATLDLRAGYGRVALVGLAESMVYLGAEGSSEADAHPRPGSLPGPLPPDEGPVRGALRALSFLGFAAREQSREAAVPLELADGTEPGIGRRFRQIDSRTYPAHVETLLRRLSALASAGEREALAAAATYPRDSYLPGVTMPGDPDPLAAIAREARLHTLLHRSAAIRVPARLPTHEPIAVLESIRHAIRRTGVHGLAFAVPAISCDTCGRVRSTPLATPAVCPDCGADHPVRGQLYGNRFTLDA